MTKNGGKAMDLALDTNTLHNRQRLIDDGTAVGLTCLDETDHVHIHDNP